MDAAFASNMFAESGPLSKRRCFVPSSDLFVNTYAEDGSIIGQDFQGPLLLEVDGRTPTQQEIEAELLRVGMRIRKSVSEGHKATAFTPRPFFNMRRLSPETQAALNSGINKQPVSTATFCGINLAALAHISSTPIEEQRMWSYSTSHKRGYEGDSDSDDQEFMPHTPTLGGGDDDSMAIPVDYFSIGLDNFEDVSPMTQINNNMSSQANGRRFARMRTRRQQQPVPQQQATYNPFAQLHMPQQVNGAQWMGHKRMTSCGIEANFSANDFGEVSFLQRREDIDMDCS